MEVSIIVPARNAEATIASTLESVGDQTFDHWEVIVVDDGSTDRTADVVAAFASNCPKVKTVAHPARGVSAARNRGIQESRGEWLLFLDADDWIARDYLQSCCAAVTGEPGLEIVIAPAARVLKGGIELPIPFREGADFFEMLATERPFPIHSWLVRRSLVVAAGGFDEGMGWCEDYDLWLRIARTKPRTHILPEVLAFYQMRPGSAASSGSAMLSGGLRMLETAHSSDPRVRVPHPSLAGGLSRHGLWERKLALLAWCAGVEIGAGRCAVRLVDGFAESNALGEDILPDLADEFLYGVNCGSCETTAGLAARWDSYAEAVSRFYHALERGSGQPGFARQMARRVDRAIAAQAGPELGFRTIGEIIATRVDLEQVVPDVSAPLGVDRLTAQVTFANTMLGTLDLPVVDGVVRSDVILDAAAAEFYWTALECFFWAGPYRELVVTSTPEGWQALRRGTLIHQAVGRPPPSRRDLHSHCFWTVFLQELWGKDWTRAEFYLPDRDEAAAEISGDAGRVEVEISAELPHVVDCGGELVVDVFVGGCRLGLVQVEPIGGRVNAQRIRAAVTVAAGLELSRIAVREALFGLSVAAELSLRDRLRSAAQTRGRAPCRRFGQPRLPIVSEVLVLGRRETRVRESSCARIADLPSGASVAVLEAAVATGECVVAMPGPGVFPRSIRYDPSDSVLALEPPPQLDFPESGFSRGDRLSFETLFAASPDPWRYSTEYEQLKYERTLRCLPDRKVAHALELACAEGHFTEMLGPRVERLLATDISEIAVARAAERCGHLENVEFVRLDFVADDFPGTFDLIVVSEALYFVGGREQLQAILRRIAESLTDGGSLLMAHAHLLVDDPDVTGFTWPHAFGAKGIAEAAASLGELLLEHEIRTPLYRIQRFRKVGGANSDSGHASSVEEIAEAHPLPAGEVARTIRWGGGPGVAADSVLPPASTDQLLILAYHRIAPGRNIKLARYCVDPRAFEQQIAFLADSGYYSVDLADWSVARASYVALPGRPLVITFDDGYEDFARHAFPVLEGRGFTAYVNLVTDRVGKTGNWDRRFGLEAQLMDWPTIRFLADRGVKFGSHTCSHRPLTALSIDDITTEMARSRAELARKLGRAVDTISYPYGAVDKVVTHLAGAVGYSFGFTSEPRRASYSDSLLALPRISVRGEADFPDFVRALRR